MPASVPGVHHVTAITGDVQRNVDFYVGVLGLRFIKKTVNFDVPDTPAFGHSKSGLSRSDYLKGVFTASDFPAPPLGQEGNLGRNTFRGPGFAQLDLSVAKNNRLPWFSSEGANLQIRGEFFNLFNRVNLTNWDTNLASGTFGKATGVLQPRTIQVSARLTF